MILKIWKRFRWDKKWVLACPNFGEHTARVKLELTNFRLHTFFFTVCFFLLVYLLSGIKYIIPWRKKPHLPRWTILTTFKSITIYTYIFNWKYLYFWPLFFNDYVTLLFLNNSAGKGSCDVIPFYNPKYLAKKSIITNIHECIIKSIGV